MINSFYKARENEKYIEHDSLHGVVAYIVIEVWIPDNQEIEAKENCNTCKRGSGVNTQERVERSKGYLGLGELCEKIPSILYTIQDREKIRRSRNNPFCYSYAIPTLPLCIYCQTQRPTLATPMRSGA
ncbi:hypothetical protein GOP47_0000880 [Adiantum capillus-veneris]|uniref:Uncharacterized protein n=1 Tax=Adiantum capillus-veneris TaxID=13818 RepID=A0A9D4VFK1_ADICA|nr:hypothetical protein GOP47_0000880 [Adiantum capillus-veneris]